MKIALITGSGGLIGSEAASFFADKFDLVVGIDNDLRQYFFWEGGFDGMECETYRKNFPQL